LLEQDKHVVELQVRQLESYCEEQLEQEELDDTKKEELQEQFPETIEKLDEQVMQLVVLQVKH
jgi:hypothetical protein